jgi:DNA-directed RNA polymerase subunit RPC12/RpoP
MSTCAIPRAAMEARGWRIGCELLGHQVDNRRFAGSTEKRCPCGERILAEDGSQTHVRHTLSCFFRHHTYVKSGERDGHDEYMCVRCGHPLLFRSGASVYAGLSGFRKRVRYLCGLFGHSVHRVTERGGLVEYACFCGHSFLRPRAGLDRITHPLVCVAAGHFVRFVERRDGYAEHVCRNCGHTFGFTSP